MIVINKNEGRKIPYEVNDTVITFDDELSLKLAKLEKDEAVHKDICYDSEGDLTTGTAGARAYVAEIDIPPRQYEEVPDEDYAIPYGDGSGGDGTVDGEEHYKRVPVPLDMDTVTLTLWAVE